MPENVEGQVSLAIINTKLDNIMALLETDKDSLKDHEMRLRLVEDNTTRLQQIFSTVTVVLGGSSLLLSVIAAYIGSRF